MIEGSGAGSGSITLTNGSGSGSRRPKNMWIRWIQIRIRNTAVCPGASRYEISLFQIANPVAMADAAPLQQTIPFDPRFPNMNQTRLLP
jgi:hypothetical protein